MRLDSLKNKIVVFPDGIHEIIEISDSKAQLNDRNIDIRTLIHTMMKKPKENDITVLEVLKDFHPEYFII